MHDTREKWDHTRWRILDLGRKSSGKCEEVGCEVFGRGRDDFLSREISEKWKKIALMLYIDKKWSSMDWEVSSFKISLDGAIEELSRGVHSKVTLMDWVAIENLSSIQKLPRWIEKLLSTYQDQFSKTSMDQNCDNSYRERKLKMLDRSPSYREVLRSCQDC